MSNSTVAQPRSRTPFSAHVGGVGSSEIEKSVGFARPIATITLGGVIDKGRALACQVDVTPVRHGKKESTKAQSWEFVVDCRIFSIQGKTGQLTILAHTLVTDRLVDVLSRHPYIVDAKPISQSCKTSIIDACYHELAVGRWVLRILTPHAC